MQKARGANVGVAAVCVFTRVCNSQTGAAVIDLGANAAFAKFSRSDESEADREGVKYTIRAGIDPHGIPELFEILLKERTEQPDAVAKLFASHPLEEDRVKQANDLIATYDPAMLRGLKKDDEAFQEFKRRVMALPPPPEPKKK